MALTSTDETDLLLPLFDALAEEPPFRTFLRRLQRRTRADYLNITLRVGNFISEHFVGPDLRSRAHQIGAPEFNALDGIHYDRLRPGRVYSADEFVPDDPALKMRRAAHMRALGIADERVVRAIDEDGISGWLIMARTGPCTAADSALLSTLAPYLGRTLRTLVLIDRQHLSARLSVDGLGRGGASWIAFDAEARVVALADGTAQLMRDFAGVALASGERVRGFGHKTEQELAGAALAFAKHPESPARTVLLCEDPRIEVLLAPVAAPSTSTIPAPIMIAHLRRRLEPSAARAGRLAGLFGLPLREAELAVALADGLSLVEAAAAMGLTIETVRNYSKRLYAKLGVRGQAEVVRLVSESVATLA